MITEESTLQGQNNNQRPIQQLLEAAASLKPDERSPPSSTLRQQPIPVDRLLAESSTSTQAKDGNATNSTTAKDDDYHGEEIHADYDDGHAYDEQPNDESRNTWLIVGLAGGAGILIVFFCYVFLLK